MERIKLFLFLISCLLSANVFATEVVRCGGKIYSLEFALSGGQSPLQGASIFKEGQIGQGSLVLTTYLLSTIQRTFPYYNRLASSFIQNIGNETDTSAEYLWKKSRLGFPSREVRQNEISLAPSCFENGKAVIFKLIRYSKLGTINLFEYEEKLFQEIAQSDVQKNFALIATFFNFHVADLKDRANLTSLIMTKEILLVPNEVLASIIQSFGLQTPEAQGICNRSSLMTDFLQRLFSLNCDLIDEAALKSIKIVKLKGDNGANINLYPQDFSGFEKLEEISIENTDMAPAILSADSFKGLDSLKKLVLPNNRLSLIPCQILGHSSNLSYLDLSHNEINDFPAKTFCGAFRTPLRGEKVLNLSHNGAQRSPRKTSYFYPRAFYGMSELTQLHMRNMNISDLPQNLFNDLPALKALDIGMNGLRNLDSFRSLSNLTYLDISENPLKTIEPQLWVSLKNLEVLRMENMSLHVLPENLSALRKLKEFYFCNRFLKEKVGAWLAELKKTNPNIAIRECH